MAFSTLLLLLERARGPLMLLQEILDLQMLSQGRLGRLERTGPDSEGPRMTWEDRGKNAIKQGRHPRSFGYTYSTTLSHP